jgi:Zn-dependent peptidase ImmA (M78 family)
MLGLGRALGVRSEYFFRPEKVAMSEVEYRKRAARPKKRLDAISHEILDHVERRMEVESLFPEPPVHGFSLPADLPDRIAEIEQIEELANSIRENWRLGMNPIPAMIDLLESHGVRVFCIDARGDDKFDGLLAQVSDSPVIGIGKYWPGDRQRFTLAHELGHVVLADRLDESLDPEKACNRFAGAFLFPKQSVEQALGSRRISLEPRELQTLKLEYGLSMGAIMRRAFDLGIIGKSAYKSLNIRFRSKGWHKEEPGAQLPPETGRVFTALVFRALAEDYIGDSKAAELLGMPLDDFRRYRRLEEADAASCQ